MAEGGKDGGKKVSFYQKKETICPVCGSSFHREEMLSGGGRLIAKKITDELRRIYEPSKKVGEIYPLIYPVSVCPECLYAAYPGDFDKVGEKSRELLLSLKERRKHNISLIFPVVDYRKPRNLITGTASYILAISCYPFHESDLAPTFKMGLSALRAAWLFDDLNSKYPGQNYDKIKLLFYKKASKYYELTVKYAQTGEEKVDSVKNFGPDLDKNYGYEGVLYLSSLLKYKYGINEEDPELVDKLNRLKQVISKVFGVGKSSKAKPSLILDLAKELYEKINGTLEEMELK